MAFRSSVDELPEPVKRHILSEAHTVGGTYCRRHILSAWPGLAGLHLSLAASRRRSVRRLPVRKQSGRAKGRCLAFVPLGAPNGVVGSVRPTLVGWSASRSSRKP